MNQNPNNINKEDVEAISILVKNIVKAIKNNNVNCDRTYKSVVKSITPKGLYVILDDSGCERAVKCSIPNADLKVGKSVWVKVPCGKLNQIHICGVV